jgi:outer membrane protein assembly factor BamB
MLMTDKDEKALTDDKTLNQPIVKDVSVDDTPLNAPKKKSIYKRWWFWLVIVLTIGFIAVGLLAFFGHRNDEKNNSGGNSNQDLDGFNSRVVRTFTPPSGTAFKYGSPLLYNEHIYIGTSERTGYDNAPIAAIYDNFFYKFNLDLNVVWEYPLQKKMVIGAAVMDSNHNLYFVTELLNDKDNANKKEQIFSTTFLTSLTESGEFRWEKQISATEGYWDHGFITPAISEDNIIYTGDDRFLAFDVDGNKLGQYPLEENLSFANYGGAPVIDNSGDVYFTSPEPMSVDGRTQPGFINTIYAYKFAPRLSSIIWQTLMGNEMLDNEGGNPNGGGGQIARGIESPPSLGVGGNVLYGLVGCTISKIDTATGELLWSLKPPQASGHFNAGAAIDSQDNLYIGTKSNTESRLYGIKADGTILWNHLVGADLYNSPILGDDNTIYVGSETLADGKFHAIDMQTGEQKWAIGKNNERKIPDFSHDAMLLYQGYAYVGVHSAVESNEAGVFSPSFYKIKVDANGYLPGSPWPRIFGGNSNSGRQM